MTDTLGQTSAPGSERGSSPRLRPLRQRRPRRLVVVAPHPDDEVLGAGGLLQHMARDRCRNGGGGRHRWRGIAPRSACSGSRPRCDAYALRRRSPSIGWVVAPWMFGGFAFPTEPWRNRSRNLTDVLSRLLGPDDLCLSPMAVGRPPRSRCDRPRCGGRRSLDPHTVSSSTWSGPGTGQPRMMRVVPWRRCRRLDLGRRQIARKRWATYAFTSQIRPLGSDHGGGALLADSVLRRFWRPFEVFIEAEL